MAGREMFSKYLVTKQSLLEARSSIILELLFVKAVSSSDRVWGYASNKKAVLQNHVENCLMIVKAWVQLSLEQLGNKSLDLERAPRCPAHTTGWKGWMSVSSRCYSISEHESTSNGAVCMYGLSTLFSSEMVWHMHWVRA